MALPRRYNHRRAISQPERLSTLAVRPMPKPQPGDVRIAGLDFTDDGRDDVAFAHGARDLGRRAIGARVRVTPDFATEYGREEHHSAGRCEVLAPGYIRPHALSGMLDRAKELGNAVGALEAQESVSVHGQNGLGKTTLLRYLAYNSPEDKFPDGIVYLSARGRRFSATVRRRSKKQATFRRAFATEGAKHVANCLCVLSRPGNSYRGHAQHERCIRCLY